MESLGINWLSLFARTAACLAIPVLVVLGLFLVKVKQPPKTFVRLIGLLTASMTILSVTLILVWFSIFVLKFANPSSSFALAFRFYLSVELISVITGLLTIILMVYYISHAAKSSLIPDHDRVYYQVALFFLPLIIMPMYYAKFVKNEFDASQTA